MRAGELRSRHGRFWKGPSCWQSSNTLRLSGCTLKQVHLHDWDSEFLCSVASVCSLVSCLWVSFSIHLPGKLSSCAENHVTSADRFPLTQLQQPEQCNKHLDQFGSEIPAGSEWSLSRWLAGINCSVGGGNQRLCSVRWARLWISECSLLILYLRSASSLMVLRPRCLQSVSLWCYLNNVIMFLVEITRI